MQPGLSITAFYLEKDWQYGLAIYEEDIIELFEFKNDEQDWMKTVGTD